MTTDKFTLIFLLIVVLLLLIFIIATNLQICYNYFSSNNKLKKINETIDKYKNMTDELINKYSVSVPEIHPEYTEISHPEYTSIQQINPDIDIINNEIVDIQKSIALLNSRDLPREDDSNYIILNNRLYDLNIRLVNSNMFYEKELKILNEKIHNMNQTIEQLIIDSNSNQDSLIEITNTGSKTKNLFSFIDVSSSNSNNSKYTITTQKDKTIYQDNSGLLLKCEVDSLVAGNKVCGNYYIPMYKVKEK